MYRRPLLLTLCLFAALTIHVHAAEHFIDALAPTSEAGSVPLNQRLSFGFSGRASSDGGITPAPPFEVVSVTLDKSSYKAYEPFLYEIVYRYTGSIATSFPAQPDNSQFPKGIAGARVVSLSLLINSVELPGGKLLAGVQALFGAPSVSGSLITIQPNDTIRVRGSGDWIAPPFTASQVPVHAEAGFEGFGAIFAPISGGEVVVNLLPQE